jgi:hypothetical protein
VALAEFLVREGDELFELVDVVTSGQFSDFALVF